MISVVTPWRTLLSAFGLIGSVKSEWVFMSIKPGAIASPSASIVLSAEPVRPGPTAAMRPPAMARSPAMPGLPAPSYKIPPRIRMSCIEMLVANGEWRIASGPVLFATRHSLFAHSRLHAQRQGRSGRARAGGGFDAAVPGDGDGAAGAGHRDQFLFGTAGQVAIAALAATFLAQRVQPARAGGAGRTGGTDRPGLAFDALRPLRPGIALRPGRSLRAFETAGERQRRGESDNGQ